jgi:hypothetical protein
VPAPPPAQRAARGGVGWHLAGQRDQVRALALEEVREASEHGVVQPQLRLPRKVPALDLPWGSTRHD